MRVGFYIPGFEHLGVSYLSAALKQAGHETVGFFDPLLCQEGFFHTPTLERLFDMENCVVERILDADLDLLAFSSVTDFFPRNRRVARAVKRRRDIPTVFGGIHCSSIPESVIPHPEIDYVVVGEGEQALVDLVERLEHGDAGGEIPNVWYEEGDRIVSPPPRPLVEHLDELPFPDKDIFYDVAPGFFKRHYTTAATRGCMFACTYCNNSRMRKLYRGKGHWRRRRSVENLLQELREVKVRYAFKDVRFWDELFIDDKPWLREFAAAYRRDIALPFYCYGHSRFIDEESVALLQQAGCRELNIGVECMGEETRRTLLRRPFSNEEIQRAFDLVRPTGIWLSTGNILGLPGQPVEEALALAAFYNENRVDHPQVYFFRYYPNTEIIDIARERKLLTDDDVADINGQERPTAGFASASERDAPDLLRIRTMIHLTTVLPRGVVAFLLARNRWRSLPTANISPFLAVASALWRRLLKRKRPAIESYTPWLRIHAMLTYGLKKIVFRMTGRARKSDDRNQQGLPR